MILLTKINQNLFRPQDLISPIIAPILSVKIINIFDLFIDNNQNLIDFLFYYDDFRGKSNKLLYLLLYEGNEF